MDIGAFLESGIGNAYSDLLRSPIGRICPRTHENWHVVMSLALFHEEFHLHFWPERLDTELLVPRSDVKPDAPRYLLSVGKRCHDTMERLAIVGWPPFFDSTIFVGDGVE